MKDCDNCLHEHVLIGVEHCDGCVGYKNWQAKLPTHSLGLMGSKPDKGCLTCPNVGVAVHDEPCRTCLASEDLPNYQPKKYSAVLCGHCYGSGCAVCEHHSEFVAVTNDKTDPDDDGIPESTLMKARIHAEVCAGLTATFKRKNADYGDSFAKMRNELPGAILVRIYDKYSRLKTLLLGAQQQVKDESIRDTLLDLANYCIMEIVEMEVSDDH